MTSETADTKSASRRSPLAADRVRGPARRGHHPGAGIGERDLGPQHAARHRPVRGHHRSTGREPRHPAGTRRPGHDGVVRRRPGREAHRRRPPGARRRPRGPDRRRPRGRDQRGCAQAVPVRRVRDRVGEREPPRPLRPRRRADRRRVTHLHRGRHRLGEHRADLRQRQAAVGRPRHHASSTTWSSRRSTRASS